MKNLSIIILLGSIILSSCKLGYVPPSAHIPMIKEKKETNITASFGLTSCDVQAAYSPSNNFLLLADVSGTFGSTTNGQSSQSGAVTTNYFGYNYNLGTGYYSLLDDKSLFETTIGFGQGKYDIGYRKLNVQPAFVWYQKKSRMSFSTRLTYVDYNKSMFVIDPGMDVSEHTTYIEPAYTLRAGSEKIKFHSQVGFTVPVSISSNRLERGFIPFFANIGLTINIAPKKAAPLNIIKEVEVPDTSKD